MQVLNFLLEEKFRGLCKALTGDRAVTFGFSGSSYSCGWKENENSFHINFAALPTNPSPAYLKALEGFLDHEVGHAIFTSFPALKRIPEKTARAFDTAQLEVHVKTTTNIVEDVRIEECMKQRYAGSKENIDFMNEYIRDEHQEKFEELEGWPAVQFTLSAMLNGWEIPPMFKKQEEYINSTCKDLVAKVPELKNTDECVDWSIEVLKRLKLEEDPPPPEEEPQEGEGDGGEGEKDSSGPQDPQEGDDDASFEEDNSPGEENQKEKSFWDKLKEMLSNEEEDEEERKAEKIKEMGLDNFDSFSPEWKEEALEELNQNELDSQLDLSTVRPYSRELDQYNYITQKGNYSYSMNPKLAYYSNKLSSLIKADTLTGWETGLDRGSISSRDLYRLGTDSRIFRRQNDLQIEDDAVFIVGLDISGSMKRGEAIKILGDVYEILGKVGMPFEVFTYTSITTASEMPFNQREQYVKQLDAGLRDLSYTRVSPVRIDVLKRYEDPYKKRKEHIFLGPGGYTPTPEAFEYAIMSMRKRTEKKKFFINITDGMPEERYRSSGYYRKIMQGMMKSCIDWGISPLNIGYKIGDNFRSIDPDAIITTKENFLDDFIQVISKRIRHKGIKF